jgi:hypothetical protein
MNNISALIETNEDVQVLIESAGEGGKKNYFIQGVFMQSEIKNKNGRVYPYSVMKEETDRYLSSFVDADRAMGELGHPRDPQQFTSINFERVSHKITSLKEDGKNWIGKAKILDTPYGKIAKNLMDEGVKFGVSSRALGSVKESNNVKIVNKDFKLITPADIVGDPSAPNAFVTNLMEGKEWIWENGMLVEKEVEIRKYINTMTINEENLLKAFHYVLSKI